MSIMETRNSLQFHYLLAPCVQDRPGRRGSVLGGASHLPHDSHFMAILPGHECVPPSVPQGCHCLAVVGAVFDELAASCGSPTLLHRHPQADLEAVQDGCLATAILPTEKIHPGPAFQFGVPMLLCNSQHNTFQTLIPKSALHLGFLEEYRAMMS